MVWFGTAFGSRRSVVPIFRQQIEGYQVFVLGAGEAVKIADLPGNMIRWPAERCPTYRLRRRHRGGVRSHTTG
jgi:FlaA1/EpsC-like NDP-sugar epimerase